MKRGGRRVASAPLLCRPFVVRFAPSGLLGDLAADLAARALEGTDDPRVLDIGCGTGYASALLSRMAATVVALEENAELAARAEETLRELGAAKHAALRRVLRRGPDMGLRYVSLLARMRPGRFRGPF